MDEENYEVVVIFSHWSLMEILNFIEDYSETKNDDQIGTVRIDRFKNKRGEFSESNRTIILMNKELYNKAIEKGLGNKQDKIDFRIAKYNLNAKHLPNKSQKGNIYLHFSKDISYRDINIQIRKKLKIMEKFGLIKHSYKLFIPLESRDTEEHKGFGYLNFTDDDINTKALVKLLLHDSKIYDGQIDNKKYLSAYWVKNKT